MATEKLGLLKNLTDRDQSWGMHEIGAGSIGSVPLELTASLRMRPNPEFRVIDEDEVPAVICRTEHQPWGVRYRR